jgi:hypothetical protein
MRDPWAISAVICAVLLFLLAVVCFRHYYSRPGLLRQDLRGKWNWESIALIPGVALWRACESKLIHWPSPDGWNRIMFASVFVLVMLGIVALSIFIVRYIRSR